MGEKSPEEKAWITQSAQLAVARKNTATFLDGLVRACGAKKLEHARKLLADLKAQVDRQKAVYARLEKTVDSYVAFILKPPEAAKVAELPDDIASMTDVRPRTGHAGVRAKIVRDASGRTFVAKAAAETDGGMAHIESESAADAVYRSLGISVPDSKTVSGGRIASEVANAVSVGEYLKTASAKKADELREEFLKGFDVDCMLANWSVVGDGLDNVLVGPDGTVYRTENCGSMSWRLKSGRKGSGEWTKDPTDFFALAGYGNQQRIFRGRTVSVLDLMRRTLGRDWKGALGSVSKDDADVIRGRLANIAKIVSHGEKLMKANPGLDADGLNAMLKEFMDGGYVEKPVWTPIEKGRTVRVANEDLKTLKKRLGSEIPKTLARAQRNIDASEASIRKSIRVKKDVVDRAEAIVKRVLDDGLFVTRVDSNSKNGRILDLIFRTHFKCQQETRTGNGLVDPAERTKFSCKAFSTDRNSENHEFEKYGYCANFDIAEEFSEKTASSYGDVIIGMRKDRTLTTFTMDDSLGMENHPSLTSDPKLSSFGRYDIERDVKMIVEKDASIRTTRDLRRADGNGFYIELQYHGPVDNSCYAFVAFENEGTLTSYFAKDNLQRCIDEGIHILLKSGASMVDVDIQALIDKGAVTGKTLTPDELDALLRALHAK